MWRREKRSSVDVGRKDVSTTIGHGDESIQVASENQLCLQEGRVEDSGRKRLVWESRLRARLWRTLNFKFRSSEVPLLELAEV